MPYVVCEGTSISSPSASNLFGRMPLISARSITLMIRSGGVEKEMRGFDGGMGPCLSLFMPTGAVSGGNNEACESKCHSRHCQERKAAGWHSLAGPPP